MARKPTYEELKLRVKELENQALVRTEDELRLANKKILEQQRSVIEEERLKVLLQMAGATVHELSQPLMGLLGNIELMRLGRDKPGQLTKYMDRIEAAGQDIAKLMKRIQGIGHDRTKRYLDGAVVTNLDQKINVFSVEDSDDDFDDQPWEEVDDDEDDEEESEDEEYDDEDEDDDWDEESWDDDDWDEEEDDDEEDAEA